MIMSVDLHRYTVNYEQKRLLDYIKNIKIISNIYFLSNKLFKCHANDSKSSFTSYLVYSFKWFWFWAMVLFQ